MAQELPYLPSYKNVETLFKKIAAARKPEVFTHAFLYKTIGLKSVSDRPLISFLRALGFLDSSNKPTALYDELKNPSKAPKVLADAIKNAYEPLFSANENAHSIDQTELKGLIAQVAGTDEAMTAKIFGTFNSLVKLADFKAKPLEKKEENGKLLVNKKEEVKAELRPEFHYNLQIHLPSNSTEETYLNIFNALRRVFK